MTTIKLKFRPSKIEGAAGRLYYQIIHERKVKQLSTNYRIYPSEWDPKRELPTSQVGFTRWDIIMSTCSKIRCDIERLTKISQDFDQRLLPYSTDDIIEEYNWQCSQYTLFNFMESVIDNLKHKGKTRTAETYVSTLQSFKKFRNSEDIMLDQISAETMEAYDSWLRKRELTNNTISFYMRILRAVYNRAVERDILTNRYPFRHVYTGIDKTVKRALPISEIKRINALELSEAPKLEFARDMFMMSFMLRGMSLIDMSFLKKSDLKNGYITYRRRKTNQRLVIRWTKEMQTLLEKYPENESRYLLPIIRKPGLNERIAYRNTGYRINWALKKIAKMIGITIPVTLYVARHSWASSAHAKGIPISIISEGMGHDSETTTQIYLAGLDTSAVDKANSLLLQALTE